MFTDIHWGAKNNSVQHNQDNLDYLDWFISTMHPDTTHIAFLGDWFEQRNAINVQTLQFATRGIKKLDELGLPIIFITGNHDLYNRHTRDVHSLNVFAELKNVILVDAPMKITGAVNFLVLPYIFSDEYVALAQDINSTDVVLGHLEFKGFVLTGHTHVAEHGPDHRFFSKPRKIFSGHYHKRQVQDNVHYIGNVFPTNFGDAGDYARGMCTYHVLEDKVEYADWPDAPTYYKTHLSDVMAEKWTPLPKMKVKCVVDVDITYQDAQELREGMIELYQLRDFVLEEDRATKQGVLEGDNVKVTESLLDFTGIDDLVTQQLEVLKTDPNVKVDPDLLISIYKDLPVEAVEGDE